MIAVTAATSHLGKLVIDDLLQRNVRAKDIVAVVRSKAKAADLSAKGIDVREADYESPEALQKALAGVDKLLLISGTEVGKRVSQHQNVINAAKANHVKQLLYTSILNADTSKVQLAVEHLATEKAIRASGIPFVFLRNGWYIENYTAQLANQIQHGVIAGSAKDGRLSAAARADYATAAAAVLTGNTKDNTIYELGGPAFTLSQLASAVSEISGKKVAYVDMPAPDYEKMLAGFGLPEPMPHLLADSDLGILRGDLFTESQDLAKLIGHPTTSVQAIIKAALKK